MRAIAQPDRRCCPRHFLARDALLVIAEPGAARFLLDGYAVQAERADLGPEGSWKLVALVAFGRARRDLLARKGKHGFANGIRGFTEIEIEHPVRIGNHGRATSGEIS